MAIVKVYKFQGATVKIDDSAYRDKTPADLEIVHKNIASVCWKIVMAARAKGTEI